MKKLLVLPLLAITISLTGCFDGDAEEYATPELFFSHIEEVSHYISVESSELSGHEYIDYNFVVRDKILEISNFESISKREPTTDTYMVYDHLHSHSTAGPNYSKLYIYDDGLAKIEYKQALGSLNTFYLTCDANEAHELNVFVKNRINQLIENDKEAEELGKKETTIENYFAYTETAPNPYIVYSTSRGSEFAMDNGKLLSTLKEITYTKTNEFKYFNDVVDYYQDDSIPVYGEGNKPQWRFRLADSLDFVSVEHAFKLNDVPYLSITCYTIKTSDGTKIVEKVQELLHNR